MEKTYRVLGMTCSGCQKKISETLNNIKELTAIVNLEEATVTLKSEKSIDLASINKALKKAGSYILEDPDAPKNTDYIPPQDRVSPSSVYYCPMECEGSKVYFQQGKRCPVCNMYLVPIEERTQAKDTHTHEHHQHKIYTANNTGKYYCPMFCEGDKVYDSNVGCPVCGMDLVQIPIAGEEAKDDNFEILKRNLITAIIFTIPVFILSMGGMFVHYNIDPLLKGWIELALSLPVIFYSGWFLLKRAWVSYKTMNLNMFSLIGLGVAAAFLFSLALLLFPESLPKEFENKVNHYYFESVCVIITLVIIGQVMEAKAHKKTGDAIKKLMSLSPAEAHIVRDNEEHTIPLSEVKKGDILRVKAGEKIPVDGTITEGSALIDESSITGEPIPIEKQVNNKVIAGTLNEKHSFLMKAERVGSETLLAQIIKMVNDAGRSKAQIQKLADKVAKVFVPAVVSISVLTFILWYIFGGESRLSLAVMNAVAVLIVACPCALGLATPMSLMVGIGKGARNGVLIKNAEALEKMNNIDVLITDKTGTLTEGKPTLAEIITAEGFSEQEAIAIAAALNQNDTHPLSKAVIAKAKQQKITISKVHHFESIAGKGITGVINHEKYALVNQAFIDEHHIFTDSIRSKIQCFENQAFTQSFLVKNNTVLALFCFEDLVKSNAKKALNFLNEKNIEVVMMTGDNEAAARAVSEKLGIKYYKSQCMPKDKMDEIKKRQMQGQKVAMTGDGINDAPALAQADIGIAMGTGTDIAIDSADIILLKGDINGITKALKLSRNLIKNIKENLFFAFVYNAVGIPIAAGLLYPIFGILLSPMFAALAMSFSSVSVILNSLRLNKVKLNN
ncbi:heavy metal translocating P-type ATPase [Riemerella columbipharyngis]|uniref:Cu2+-exporting ATPase n=1 Tax=Riemerella columbipharyngis TaxID=1071918 RepID=A0A1G7A793_9FLAO|nr:heavy metal translocating P-type ATPase [Riemerella columbipharyngis]SDE09746.1 Cu2+-exporting ATPase [Riemerella columbipharyngis]